MQSLPEIIYLRNILPLNIEWCRPNIYCDFIFYLLDNVRFQYHDGDF